jgi:hypothetical protein
MRNRMLLAIMAMCAIAVCVGTAAGASTKASYTLITDKAEHFSFKAPTSFIRQAPQNSDEFVYLNDSSEYGQLFVIDPEGLISVAGLKRSVLLLEESTGGEYAVSFAPSVSRKFAAGSVNMVIFSVNSTSTSKPVYGVDAGFRRGRREFAVTSYSLSLAQAKSNADLALNTWASS